MGVFKPQSRYAPGIGIRRPVGHPHLEKQSEYRVASRLDKPDKTGQTGRTDGRTPGHFEKTRTNRTTGPDIGWHLDSVCSIPEIWERKLSEASKFVGKSANLEKEQT
eukprot:gene22318-biopygen7919